MNYLQIVSKISCYPFFTIFKYHFYEYPFIKTFFFVILKLVCNLLNIPIDAICGKRFERIKIQKQFEVFKPTKQKQIKWKNSSNFNPNRP